jgi:short-subunit dehydrogenase
VAISDEKRGLALITGASSGIGAAFARALAARHHPLLLVARRRDRLLQLARELGRDVAILEEDLTAPGAIERVTAAARTLAPLEILINNAGYGTHGAFLERDPERERDMIRLNALVPLQLSRALLPSLVAQGRGGIINIASIGAFQPVPYMATYGASKAFVLSLSEALHEELRDSRVRVLCLCPGPTATEFFGVAGMPAAMGKLPHTMRADELVARALDAFADGQAVMVPGLINFLGAVFARIAPRVLARKATRLMFQPRGPKAVSPPQERSASQLTSGGRTP